MPAMSSFPVYPHGQDGAALQGGTVLGALAHGSESGQQQATHSLCYILKTARQKPA